MDGGYYVADSGNRRIQKFAPDRSFLLGWSRQGIVDSQLLVTARGNRTSGTSVDSCPVALVVDQQGRVIVSDRVAAEILVFAADGRPLVTATEKGMRPEGVTVDSAGNLWVADNGNRVLQFSPDGTLLTTWGSSGHDDGEFTTPMSIAVDAQGRVFVGDQSGRVQIFAPDGAFLGALASRGIDSQPFSEPVGLFLDGLGHLYVVEHYGNRVYKFRLLAPFGS